MVQCCRINNYKSIEVLVRKKAHTCFTEGTKQIDIISQEICVTSDNWILTDALLTG